MKADFEFYTVSGQLEGDPASLKVEDFWTFDVVEGRGRTWASDRAREQAHARAAVADGDGISSRRPWRSVRRHVFWWRLASIAIVCGAWEVARRVPINYAFPSFSDTALALARMIADGSLPKAYVSTLQPLLLGIAISAGSASRSA